MKFRNIVSLIAGASILFSTVVYADTIKVDGVKINREVLLSDVQIELPMEIVEDPMINFFGTNEEVQPELSLIKGEYPWNYMTYGNEIKVGVIDSGYTFHSDLDDNILEGWNYFTESIDVTDDVGHGTHVSGIIAALSNGSGMVGVAPKAKIVPLKVGKYVEVNGEKKVSIPPEIAFPAIIDAVDKYNCDIISMSWGITETSIRSAYNKLWTEELIKATMEKYNCTEEEAKKALEEEDGQALINSHVEESVKEYIGKIDAIINYAYRKGVTLIAAVGNNTGETLNYPANCENVIGVSSVGTVDSETGFSTFSNYNSSSFVCAPGYQVRSTYNNGGYATMNGTSQATPHVAGLAAIAKSINPNITQDEFKQLLIDTSEDLGDEGWDKYYGYGLIDAEALVKKMIKDKVYVSPINYENEQYTSLIFNNTTEDKTGISIWADFGTTLTSVNAPSDISIKAGETKTVTHTTTSPKFKHFLWEGLESMTPLGISRTFGE